MQPSSTPYRATVAPPMEAKQPVQVYGHWMMLHDFERDRWISPFLAAGRLFEPFETEWIENLVRPGDTVLDIGGHIGFYTLLMARSVGPAGRVLAFEPDPANFALLQQNVALNRYANVSLYNVALSDQASSVSLFQSTDNAGDHRIWQPAESRPSVRVSTVALDEFLDPTHMRVDFIKMDIQGAEVRALQGMQKLLQHQPHVTLISEFWPMGMRGAGASAETFLRILSEMRFRFYLIDEHNGRLIRVESAQLLQIFDVNKDGFGNVMCVKA